MAQNETEAEVLVLKARVAELEAQLAALEEERRWRPIVEWPDRGFLGGPVEYEVASSDRVRFIVSRSIGFSGLRLQGATKFRPVVGPDPEPSGGPDA